MSRAKQSSLSDDDATALADLFRLLGGEAVTTIAFDLDYSSPAAFTTMFKKLVGTTPHAYRRAAS